MNKAAGKIVHSVSSSVYSLRACNRIFSNSLITLPSRRNVTASRNIFDTRLASSSAVQATKARTQLEPPKLSDVGSTYSPSPSFPGDQNLDNSSELMTLEAMKDKISSHSWKALTAGPFHFTSLTPVQQEVFKLLPEVAYPFDPSRANREGETPRDLLVRAKTGTGKTFAFLVPAIEARLNAIEAYTKQAVRDAGLDGDSRLEERARKQFVREHVGALIISPTRELATQIAKAAVELTTHHKGFEVRLFVGGESKRKQMNEWMKGRRDIVVTTPGRMRDFLSSEPEVAKGMAKCKVLILDEADTLLDMGFRDDIDDIASYLPPTPQRQTFLFSATVSRAIQQIARSMLDSNHAFIDAISEDTSPVHAHIPQYHTVLPTSSEQLPHVLRLIAHDQLSNPKSSKIIIFLPTTKMTQLFSSIFKELSRSVLPAGMRSRVYEIHSKKNQSSRTTASNAFRNDTSGASILVTSDVSARGVDYPGVTRVIQVGIPGSPEQYVHRVGRTGRAGTGGRGDLVLLPWETSYLSGQLHDVPLKPLTTAELKSQVIDLSTRHDENVAQQGAYASPRTGNVIKKSLPVHVAERINGMDTEIQQLKERLDKAAIEDTFASLLGYYVAKSGDLRLQKEHILEGCKEWSMEVCGLATPPSLSGAFLRKLGLMDGRGARFGSMPPKRRVPSRDRWDDDVPARRGKPWSPRNEQRGHADADDSFDNAEERRRFRYDRSDRRDSIKGRDVPGGRYDRPHKRPWNAA